MSDAVGARPLMLLRMFVALYNIHLKEMTAMSNHEQSNENGQVPVEQSESAKCLEILERGVKRSADLKLAMSALMSDLAAGRITVGTGNAICSATSKILKTVELEQKYGTRYGQGKRELLLIEGDDAAPVS